MAGLWKPSSEVQRLAFCAPWTASTPPVKTRRFWKGPRMRSVEEKYKRPFWDVVRTLAARGKTKRDVARILGYGDKAFLTLIKNHQPEAIDWPDPQQTPGMQKAREARRGKTSPAMNAAMAKAREVQAEGIQYDLHGYVGSIADHARRQKIPYTTVIARKRRGWRLSEALGYVPRAKQTDGRPRPGYAPKRIAAEAKYGMPWPDILRHLYDQGLSQTKAAKELNYDDRAFSRLLNQKPEWNCWAGSARNVIELFRQKHGIAPSEWLLQNAAQHTLTTAAQFIGYGHPSGLIDYMKVRGIEVEFLNPGRHHTYRGVTRNIKEHAIAHGLKPVTVHTRLARGMSLEEALTAPVVHRNRKRKSA